MVDDFAWDNPFQMLFQCKSACQIILDFPSMTMVHCPQRGAGVCCGNERDDVEAGGTWVLPGVPHNWGGGRHLRRGILGLSRHNQDLALFRRRAGGI